MLDRVHERFDTAEARISYRLWNESSVDTAKALVEKIAIEGVVSLAIGTAIAAGVLGAGTLLGIVTDPVATLSGCVAVALAFVKCNFGSADSYSQADADR